MKTKRLSTAILRNIKRIPQHFRGWVRRGENDKPVAACVLYTVMLEEFEGARNKGEINDAMIIKLREEYPILRFQVKNPMNSMSGMCDSVENICVRLNDDDEWSREMIAKWVIRVEKCFYKDNDEFRQS